jgi:flagellar protein FliS
MESIANEEYLVTQVMTAPPQKLQLLLIDAALRFAAKAKAHWAAGEKIEAGEALLRCQEIVTEIMSGIRADANRALAGKVSAIYSFIFRSLVAAHLRADEQMLNEAMAVLEIERQTWQMLCVQLAQTAAIPAIAAPTVSESFSLEA